MAIYEEKQSSMMVPPHSIEAEQAVLGGLLIEHQRYDEVSEILGAGDFYHLEHQTIFRAMQELITDGTPIDVVTVGTKLGDTANLGYLVELARNTPSAANAVPYAQLVRTKSLERALIREGSRIVERGFSPEGKSTSELIDEAQASVLAIADTTTAKTGPIRSNIVLKQVLNRIETAFELGQTVTGLPSGFESLDGITSGFHPGDLIIVAARPGMGKTSLALNFLEFALLKQPEKPAVLFSMEMPSDQIVTRMLSSIGRINLERLRTGQLEEEDWPKLGAAAQIVNTQKLFIDESGGLSPMDLRSRMRRIVREQGTPSLLVVDYLQLMRVPGAEGRVAEITEISMSLKRLAKELHIPIVALSQLNRNLENRPNKRPLMSDLRDSGSIEQDADLILMLYRDDQYNEDSEDPGVAELNVAKHRNGPTGVVRLAFQGRYTRFDDINRG